MLESYYNTRPNETTVLDKVGEITPAPNNILPKSSDIIEAPNTTFTNTSTLNETAGKLNSKYGGYANAATAALAAFNKQPVSNDKYAQKGEAIGNALGQAKNAGLSMLGPAGQLAATVSGLGEGIGNAIGGDAGTAISSVFSPEKAIANTWSDPDLKTGDKLLGTVLPMYGAFKSKKAQKERLRRQQLEARQNDLNKMEIEELAELKTQDGIKNVENAQAIYNKQLGFISSNY